MINRDFISFLFPASVPDRRAAVGAIAAGFFISFILAACCVVSTAIVRLREGASSPRVTLLLGASVILVAITVGIWKRILLASVVGLIVSVIVLVWQLRNERIAAALVLAIPLLGGFSASIRGIIALQKLERSEPPKG